jgi:hypothetical protein
MRRKLITIGVFALLGFIVSWALLAYSAYAYSQGFLANPAVFVWLCPPSIVSMALYGNASYLVVFFWWLGIALSNSALYSLVGALASFFVPRQTSRERSLKKCP